MKIKKTFSNKIKTIHKFTKPIDFNIEKITSSFNETNKINSLQSTTNTNTNDNKLNTIISNIIKSKGPISLSEYINISLFNKDHGYYSTKEFIFGNKGDFITSPEISQLFGEMISIWITKQIEVWNDPKEIDILEIGPGRGSLTTDMIRSFVGIYKGGKKINCYLIEKSSKLKKIQQENVFSSLMKYSQKPKLRKVNEGESVLGHRNILKEEVEYIESIGFNVVWLSSLEEFISILNSNLNIHQFNIQSMSQIEVYSQLIKENHRLNPLIVLANELFDALPINKITYNNGVWKEILIGLKDKEETLNTKDSPLKYVLSENETEIIKKFIKPEETFHGLTVNEGYKYEISIQSIKYMVLINMIMTQRYYSSGLIIDYGDTTVFEDSFRGIKDHKILKEDEILKYSGQCDLSSYVNFNLLKKTVRLFHNLECPCIMYQGVFLELMGIKNRIDNLVIENKKDLKIEKLLNWQYNKLTDPDEMGENFKFMYIKKRNHSCVYPFIPEVIDRL